jgi:hypothetical protein
MMAAVNVFSLLFLHPGFSLVVTPLILDVTIVDLPQIWM